jgi:Cu-Zn family superoxide dismutase
MTRPAAVLTAHAVVAAAVLLAGCRGDDAGTAPLQSSDAPSLARGAAGAANAAGGGGASHATATMYNGAGDAIGEARFTEDGTGAVHLTVHVKGLTPGLHGLHVHAIGSCVGPAFTSAGGHYNPATRQHGHLNPLGFHAGDLPNLIVNADGVGYMKHTTSRITLSPGPVSVFDADGTAVIVHLNPDRGINGVAGASGGPRMACGVVQWSAAGQFDDE